MKKFVTIVACICGALLLGGCGHTALPYSPAFPNVNTLHRLNKGQPIALGKFTDPKQTRSITCRMEGGENLPGDVTYVEYIKNALQQELNNASLYSSKAKTRLDANLDVIDFSSMFDHSTWVIKMTFNDHKQAPYTVRSVYKFSTNFVADIACTQVSQAYVPAVQKFLLTLYQNKHFQRTLGHR